MIQLCIYMYLFFFKLFSLTVELRHLDSFISLESNGYKEKEKGPVYLCSLGWGWGLKKNIKGTCLRTSVTKLEQGSGVWVEAAWVSELEPRLRELECLPQGHLTFSSADLRWKCEESLVQTSTRGWGLQPRAGIIRAGINNVRFTGLLPQRGSKVVFSPRPRRARGKAV